MANFSRSTVNSVSGDQINISGGQYILNFNNVSSDSLVSVRSTGSGVVASFSSANSSSSDVSTGLHDGTMGIDRWRDHREGRGRQRIGNEMMKGDPVQASLVELQRELPESDAHMKMKGVAVVKRGQHIYLQPTERLV